MPNSLWHFGVGIAFAAGIAFSRVATDRASLLVCIVAIAISVSWAAAWNKPNRFRSTMLAMLVLFAGCSESRQIALPAWRTNPDLAYIRGSNDAELRMQNDAIRYGSARLEGENNEWFVWANDPKCQRFPRAK